MAILSGTGIGDWIKSQIDRPRWHIKLVVYSRGAATLSIEILRTVHYNILVSLLLLFLLLNIDHCLAIINILFISVLLLILFLSVGCAASWGHLLVQRGSSLRVLLSKDHLLDLWLSALVSFIVKLWTESAFTQHLLFLKPSRHADVLLVNLSLLDK